MTATRPSSSTDGSRPSAFTFALARLARRAHSEKELSAKLERASYSASEIEDALQWLRARRYLDDGDYARAYAERAVREKCWGPERIAGALRVRSMRYVTVASATVLPHPDSEGSIRGERTQQPRGDAGSEIEPTRLNTAGGRCNDLVGCLRRIVSSLGGHRTLLGAEVILGCELLVRSPCGSGDALQLQGGDRPHLRRLRFGVQHRFRRRQRLGQ